MLISPHFRTVFSVAIEFSLKNISESIVHDDKLYLSVKTSSQPGKTKKTKTQIAIEIGNAVMAEK